MKINREQLLIALQYTVNVKPQEVDIEVIDSKLCINMYGVLGISAKFVSLKVDCREPQPDFEFSLKREQVDFVVGKLVRLLQYMKDGYIDISMKNGMMSINNKYNLKSSGAEKNCSYERPETNGEHLFTLTKENLETLYRCQTFLGKDDYKPTLKTYHLNGTSIFATNGTQQITVPFVCSKKIALPQAINNQLFLGAKVYSLEDYIIISNSIAFVVLRGAEQSTLIEQMEKNFAVNCINVIDVEYSKLRLLCTVGIMTNKSEDVVLNFDNEEAKHLEILNDEFFAQIETEGTSTETGIITVNPQILLSAIESLNYIKDDYVVIFVLQKNMLLFKYKDAKILIAVMKCDRERVKLKKQLLAATMESDSSYVLSTTGWESYSDYKNANFRTKTEYELISKIEVAREQLKTTVKLLQEETKNITAYRRSKEEYRVLPSIILNLDEEKTRLTKLKAQLKEATKCENMEEIGEISLNINNQEELMRNKKKEHKEADKIRVILEVFLKTNKKYDITEEQLNKLTEQNLAKLAQAESLLEQFNKNPEAFINPKKGVTA